MFYNVFSKTNKGKGDKIKLSDYNLLRGIIDPVEMHKVKISVYSFAQCPGLIITFMIAKNKTPMLLTPTHTVSSSSLAGL